MSRIALICVAALALPAATQIPSQVSEPPVFALLNQVGKLADAGKVEEGFHVLDRAAQRYTDPQSRAAVEQTRAILYLAESKQDQAAAAFDRVMAIAPENPALPLAVLQTTLEMGAFDISIRTLDRLISQFPVEARSIEVRRLDPIYVWLRENKQAERANQLRMRLADIGFGGDWIATHDFYALTGAREHLRRGELASAISLVKGIDDRDTLVDMLTNREFEPLWPSLAMRIGPHMEQPVNEALIVTERLFKDHPDSIDARSTRMTALANAGKFEEAARIGAAFAPTAAEAKALDEDGGWLVNQHATLLYQMGRKDESDARFAALMTNDIEQKPWLINMVINRVSHLAQAGDTARAAPLLAQAERLTERFGNKYAMQIIRKLKVCTAAEMKPPEPTDPLVADLLAHAEDSNAATIEGLLCAKHMDEAARRLIDLLGNPDERALGLAALQPNEIEPSPSGAAPNSDNFRLLLARPDVKNAFEKYGRVLPKEYWPEPSRPL